MLPAPKTVALFCASFTNAATATGTVDTKGYDYAVIEMVESASNAVTNNCSVLKIAEGDTTSAYTNVSGLVGDTDFTIPNSVTTGVQVVAQLRINLRARKRYLELDASPVTTQVLAAVCHLYKGSEVPVSATDAGVGVLVEDA